MRLFLISSNPTASHHICSFRLCIPFHLCSNLRFDLAFVLLFSPILVHHLLPSLISASIEICPYNHIICLCSIAYCRSLPTNVFAVSLYCAIFLAQAHLSSIDREVLFCTLACLEIGLATFCIALILLSRKYQSASEVLTIRRVPFRFRFALK